MVKVGEAETNGGGAAVPAQDGRHGAQGKNKSPCYGPCKAMASSSSTVPNASDIITDITLLRSWIFLISQAFSKSKIFNIYFHLALIYLLRI